jgi:P27 family predicted phage terminase small subunit
MPRGRKEKPAKAIAGLPQPPSHLTPSAKILFEAIVADLVKQGSCVATDAHLIALYAETRDYATELRATIDACDKTTTSEGYGALKRHPLIDPYLAAVKSAALYLTKLGLTPASRPKSQMGDDDVSRFHE